MKAAGSTSKTDEIARASGSLEAVGIKQTLIRSRDPMLYDRTHLVSAPSVLGEEEGKVHFCRNTGNSLVRTFFLRTLVYSAALESPISSVFYLTTL